MNEVRDLRMRAGLSQKALAAAAGTSQPTIAAYESGRKVPSVETLRRLAAAAGLEMQVQFVPPLTREDRRSLALHEAVARELLADPLRVRAKAKGNLSRMRNANPGAAPLLREWEVLLDRPLEDLVALLRDPMPRARELRHVTPFAGVLTTGQRAEVYRQFRETESKRQSPRRSQRRRDDA
jgi:transcriptional regulator with XRE-family HTH domain